MKFGPSVLAQCPTAKLLLAGSVCDQLRADPNLPLTDVEVLGRIKNLKEFYEKVDICWNPVRFGTGLKIKSLEALAHTRPLLTTPQGAEGLPFSSDHILETQSQEAIAGPSSCLFSSDNAEELAKQAVQWTLDRAGFANRVRAATYLATHELSVVRVYSDLRELLGRYNR